MRLTLIFFLFSLTVHAQFSKLRIRFNNLFETNERCYKFYLTAQTDTIYTGFFTNDYENEIDSLKPGVYKIRFYKCDMLNEPTLVRYITLYPDKVTNIDFDFSIKEAYYDINRADTVVKSRAEAQYHLSCMQNNWIDKKSNLRFGATFGITGYDWRSFSKHMGLLMGGGIGLGHYAIAKDTTFINLPQFKKQYEYYNYADCHVDVKFRFTIGNQQTENNLSPKVIIDIGALYNLPIVFKHIVRYNDNKKITNSTLHQFTDVRTYVNFGYNPLLLFIEYRPMDFIMGNYPELSKYNVGIKIIMN